MDIIKQLQEAHKVASEKYRVYSEIDSEVAKQIDGFFDISILEKLKKAYSEWQLAANEYHNLLSYLEKNKNLIKMEQRVRVINDHSIMDVINKINEYGKDYKDETNNEITIVGENLTGLLDYLTMNLIAIKV